MTTPRRVPAATVVTALVTAALVAALAGWLLRPGDRPPEVQQAGTERFVVRLAVPDRRTDPWRVEVDRRDGRPGPVPDVRLEPVMTGMGHALDPVTAQPDGPGRYRAAVTLPMAGPWEITVRLDDGAGTEQAAFAVLR